MERSRTEELEAFKSEIDLVAFAQSYGFVVDRRKTSRSSVAMKHATNGERILVARSPNGHFVYASVHDPADNGTIVDFAQRRGGGNLGEVRKALRPWIGRAALPYRPPSPTEAASPETPRLEPVRVDFEAVRRVYEVMAPIAAGHPYLEGVRGIPSAVYLHPKFQGRIRIDSGHGNVVFPHWQAAGQLTGFEIKNQGFTGFAKGGSKRLFGSGIAATDAELVVCETAIDALSYAALFGVQGRRFVSTAGALNPLQPLLLRAAMEKLPDGGCVVSAVDADVGGDALHEQFAAIFEGLPGRRVAFRRHSPAARGHDWNDILRGRAVVGSAPPPWREPG